MKQISRKKFSFSFSDYRPNRRAYHKSKKRQKQFGIGNYAFRQVSSRVVVNPGRGGVFGRSDNQQVAQCFLLCGQCVFGYHHRKCATGSVKWTMNTDFTLKKVFL